MTEVLHEFLDDARLSVDDFIALVRLWEGEIPAEYRHTATVVVSCESDVNFKIYYTKPDSLALNDAPI